MKKIYNVMMLAAVAAAALVSCAKEMDKTEVGPNEEGIKVSLVADDAITKTYLDGTSAKFKATDAVGVFDGATTNNIEFDNTKADGVAAVFSGSVPAAGTYYAYYPYQAGAAVVAENGVKFKFPETQYPTPTSFDGAADLLLSESFSIETTGAENVNVKFRRLGGFLKFYFLDGTTGSILSAEHAKEVKVIVDNKINETARPCPTVYVTPSGIGTVGKGMKTIAAEYADGVYTLTASGQAAYFGVFPQTFAVNSTFALTIKTDSYTITKTLTLTSEVELGAGDILPIQVTIADANVAPRAKETKVEKVWELLSPNSSTAWTQQYLGAKAESDRNVAIDGTNVYVAEFSNNGTDKNIYAINIAGTTTGNPDFSTLPVGTVTTDKIRAVTCPRVVKNSSGEPVLMVSGLSNSAGTQNLYVYDNPGGITADPRVVTLSRAYSSQRLGDTFSVWGTYEQCMLFFHGMDGNGFVTFPFSSGLSAASATLTGRIATDGITVGEAYPYCSGVSSFHPYPDNINNGIANNRTFGRYHELRTSPSLWDTWGAITPENTRMDGIWETVNTNAGTEGHNFIEFNGKRYVIYGCRIEDYTKGYLVIKQGGLSDSWLSIINKGTSSTITLSELYGNGHTSGNGKGLDVAVWQEADQVWIAIDMQDVGLQVYRMYKW